MAPKRSSSVKTAPKRVNEHFKSTHSKPALKKSDGGAVSNVVREMPGGPPLIIKDAQWDGIHRKARKAMGDKAASTSPLTRDPLCRSDLRSEDAQPVHGDVNNVNRVDDVLRVFDLTYKYGPATGMTRLERWNRAEELGLEPPVEVKDILLTKEGLNDPRYCDSYATNAGV